MSSFKTSSVPSPRDGDEFVVHGRACESTFQKLLKSHSTIAFLVAGGEDERNGPLLNDVLQENQEVPQVLEFSSISLLKLLPASRIVAIPLAKFGAGGEVF